MNTNRWFFRLRGEARTADLQRFLSIRGTADARFSVARHFSLTSQFQIVEGRTREREWEETNRLGAGFELPFASEHVDFSARVVMEHYWLPASATYDRWRQRAAFRFTTLALKPQAGSEVIVDREGWTTTRLISGVLIPLNRRIVIDAGYYYDFRPFRQGGDRQIIYTYLRFRKPRP